MPDDDLDDLDLERTREPEGTKGVTASFVPGVRGGRLLPATLAAAAVVAIALLAVFFLVFRHPATPKTVAAPAPTATTSSPLPRAPASPPVPLPALDDSDAFVRQLAAGLSSHPELGRWLARTALVRTLTAVVLNVADSETPRPHLEFLAPTQRFRASGRRGRIVPDPAAFAGYDLFGDAVGSVDAAAAAGAYRALEPLFEAAYRDLGHPEGGFADAINRAIAALLAVPTLKEDVLLVPHATGFRYADPKLEGLTAAQKQFLRIGPRNVALVQTKLRELAVALRQPSPPTH
jgi:hypothetical protein